jgi:outer membrane protein
MKPRELSMKWCLLLLLCLSCFQPLLAQETSTREVTLQEVVDLALKNNIGLEIERYNPEITATEITAQEGLFDPLLNSFINTTDATFPTASELEGASVNLKEQNWNFLFQQKTKFSTAYRVEFNNSRGDTNQLFVNVNPQYNSSLFVYVLQPLLRNFGPEFTTMPLKRAEIDLLASDFRLKQRVLDIVLLVEQDYWNLVFARKQLRVFQQSLDLAKELYENNKKQVEVGTMAPLDIVVAEAEVAARTEGIITGETLIRNTEDRLKLAVLGNQVEKSWPLEIIPTEEPALTDIGMTEEEAIQRALQDSPDLKALKADVDSNTLTTRIAKNFLKPQLDLEGNYGFRGLGGDILNIAPDGQSLGILVPGGYSDSLSSMWDNKTWYLGVVFGLPIRNNVARADYVRADLTQQQSQKVYENARQQLILNVRTTIHNIRSNKQRLDAAIASRILQEKKLDAERKKLSVGLSTNYTVLLFQDDLSRALFQELTALVDYKKEQAQLNRFLGSFPYMK